MCEHPGAVWPVNGDNLELWGSGGDGHLAGPVTVSWRPGLAL